MTEQDSRPRHESPEFGRAVEDLTDEELYNEYQFVKQHGPVVRLDECQLEIAQRWEDEFERRES